MERSPAEPTRGIRYQLAYNNGQYMAMQTNSATWFWREAGKKYYVRPDGLVIITEVS